MKRILTYILVVCFAAVSVGGNSWAVKKKTNKKKVTVVKKAPVKKPIVKSVKGTKGAKKKYDTFIDKNKNGIDDRRENLKSTKGKKKAAKAKKTTKTKKSDSKKK
ncbi:MAG: hypothetical protein KOO62_10690 [candidate division Zixibacteria bacterium]|nr:hypothetical protein [candidate division Zixibacteria bacterium]